MNATTLHLIERSSCGNGHVSEHDVSGTCLKPRYESIPLVVTYPIYAFSYSRSFLCRWDIEHGQLTPIAYIVVGGFIFQRGPWFIERLMYIHAS